MNKQEALSIAQKFLSECAEHGFVAFVRGNSIVGVSRKFSPGDKQAFCECDMMAGSVLDVIPQRGGSQFGTDGGSVGGAIALQKGFFEMKATGCSKTVVAALAICLASGR